MLDTTFPHDKPQMLYWNVQSEFDGEATIQITYFTSGITWTADYIAIADADEKTVDVEGFVRVHNNSGEEYEDAQVRLVVGTINLVEKIAQLAQIPMADVEQARRRDVETTSTQGRAKMLSTRRRRRRMRWRRRRARSRKEIIKEGLSEYFIYTIEGTETIPNGWSKRMRSLRSRRRAR